MKKRQRTVEKTIENGKWRIENGKWGIENGELRIKGKNNA
jgi:hypothetical protein